MQNHFRYFQIAGMTLKVESDLPITASTFHRKFRAFEVEQPGSDLITLRHHFELPKSIPDPVGEPYKKPPWIIYRSGDKWIYLNKGSRQLRHAAFFDSEYCQADLHSNGSGMYEEGSHESLTLFPTDQILLARLLADRQAFLIHASGVALRGQGYLFVGHSEAGKSTIAKMLAGRAEILCDDRIIVRRWPDLFRIHGSWSHGEIADVSGASAPLLGIFFLEKSSRNCLVPVNDSRATLGTLLSCLIKPFCTAEWWERVLGVVEQLAREVRFYRLEFDKTGRIADILEGLLPNR